ncbi:MAG: dUTP diphosphatase [Pseudohongiella sp.]|nr:dUTP diphosphatase [Pseudohongiella sp.]
MLSIQQAEIMLSLQAAMNSKVDPDWIAAKYPYLRAVVIEGAEAIEHHGWKWWKKQDKDLAQLQMELIDIWHFVLSEILLDQAGDESKSLDRLLQMLATAHQQAEISFDSQTYALEQLDLISKLELLIALSASRRIELAVFASIMKDSEMDWTNLYCQYVGKNVLNFFRQDNGYKEGSYQKMWRGREDNEYLVDIMAELDPGDLEYQVKVYSALAQHYPG